MSQVFAQAQVTQVIIDPGSRKPVGEKTRDVNRAFDTEAQTLEDIQAWARGLKVNSCVLIFETEPDNDKT